MAIAGELDALEYDGPPRPGSFVGIDARRKLPAFAPETFESWFARRPKTNAGAGTNGRTGKVVLFHDTFINYNYPEIGRAATQLLEAAGYEVRIAEQRKCCGRPMISKGLAEEAQSECRYSTFNSFTSSSRRVIPLSAASRVAF